MTIKFERIPIPLNCPFCGEKASAHNDTDSPLWFIGCGNMKCHVEPYLYAHSEEEAVTLWNTRN